jgi:tetratricopeptide (TPR) repeat protein
VLRLDPDFIVPHYLLGRALADEQRFAEAIEEYRKTLDGPARPEAYAEMSYALTMLKRYPEAIEAAKNALRITPRSARAVAVLAMAYRNSHQFRKSLPCLRFMLRLNPDDTWAREALAGDHKK